MKKLFIISLSFLLALNILGCIPALPKSPEWKNKPVYTSNSRDIVVKTGTEFIIGFEITYDMFPIIEEIYEVEKLTLVERQYILDKSGQIPEYCWFLFKAVQAGNTQITIQHRLHLSDSLENEEVFQVEVK